MIDFLLATNVVELNDNMKWVFEGGTGEFDVELIPGGTGLRFHAVTDFQTPEPSISFLLALGLAGLVLPAATRKARAHTRW